MLNILRLLSPPYSFFTHNPCESDVNHVALSHTALTQHQICTYVDVCGYGRSHRSNSEPRCSGLRELRLGHVLGRDIFLDTSIQPWVCPGQKVHRKVSFRSNG